MCTVKSGYKDKVAKCRFFVVPGDCPALFGMSDSKMLNILRITCEVISNPHVSRKL